MIAKPQVMENQEVSDFHIKLNDKNIRGWGSRHTECSFLLIISFVMLEPLENHLKQKEKNRMKIETSAKLFQN